MTAESLSGFHRKRVCRGVELCLSQRTGAQLRFHAREHATWGCRAGQARPGSLGPPRAPLRHAARPGPGGQFHLRRTFLFFFVVLLLAVRPF